MKVELEKITLDIGALTDNVYAGVLNKNRTQWLHKVDVTNAFIDCVIKRWEGQVEEIGDGNSMWEITVKKIK